MNGEPWPPISMIPTIQAVTFMGVVNGKHRCRPATEAEIQLAANQPWNVYVSEDGRKQAVNQTQNAEEEVTVD